MSFSRYLTSKTSSLHHFRPGVIMAFYGKRTFLGLPSCKKTCVLQKRVTIFFSNLTQYGSMIEIHMKAKKWVCRRLSFELQCIKCPICCFFFVTIKSARNVSPTAASSGFLKLQNSSPFGNSSKRLQWLEHLWDHEN